MDFLINNKELFYMPFIAYEIWKLNPICQKRLSKLIPLAAII